MNLGDVQHHPLFLEDGKIKLVYQEGDMCKKNITEAHIKTTISFICDFEAMVNFANQIILSIHLSNLLFLYLQETIPEYVGGSEECHYQLIWKTAAACSVESLRNHSAITAGKCTVNNPLTNFT